MAEPEAAIPGVAAGGAASVLPGVPFRYAAFISYRHVEPDRQWAQWLHSALETYRVPKALARERGIPRRLGRVFRDEEELSASSDLSDSIEQALGQSRFLIVVCSPRTPGSQWVNREVERFRELGRGDRILALLIEGEPAESFPRALREIRSGAVDAAGVRDERIEEIEPLAADVRTAASHTGSAGYAAQGGHVLARAGGRRSRGHARRSARLRLLATLLGVRFDDLRQREQERRTRRFAYAAAGVAVVALAMAALAVLAVLQRNEAHRQRGLAEQREREAVEQRRVAQQNAAIADEQRSLALDTLNGLIFEVHDRLDRPGLSGVREEIL